MASAMPRRTNVDAAREAVRDLAGWLARLDWLTDAAWILTLGCLGCAILDSYTSLCVVGGSLGHIGSAAACPDFGGWDTRVFPVAVDAGWGGALFAVLRLARTIGLRSWRWWVVLTFEAITAAFTIAGNAFHGAVADGAASGLAGAAMVVITCVASAVPGVVAVGSGFTLSVLISSRESAGEPPGRIPMESPPPPAAEAPVTPSAPGPRGTAGRRPATEVLGLVASARGRLRGELEREPSDEEVASRVSAAGHPITASRVRTYLARLRAQERAGSEEVVAWRGR